MMAYAKDWTGAEIAFASVVMGAVYRANTDVILTFTGETLRIRPYGLALSDEGELRVWGWDYHSKRVTAFNFTSIVRVHDGKGLDNGPPDWTLMRRLRNVPWLLPEIARWEVTSSGVQLRSGLKTYIATDYAGGIAPADLMASLRQLAATVREGLTRGDDIPALLALMTESCRVLEEGLVSSTPMRVRAYTRSLITWMTGEIEALEAKQAQSSPVVEPSTKKSVPLMVGNYE
jgi:hypothetical protein